MSIIIAGMFENIFQAEVAAESLRRHHFADDDVCRVVCNPPGAEASGNVGSLSETLQKFDGKGIENSAARRRAGVMVAARVDGVAEEQTAIQVLQAEGAFHVEKAEGKWSAGSWADFDPMVEPGMAQDLRVNPLTWTVDGYRASGKVLVGQAHQMGRAGGAKRARSTS